VIVCMPAAAMLGRTAQAELIAEAADELAWLHASLDTWDTAYTGRRRYSQHCADTRRFAD
jgi:hypothetical protein